MIKFEVGKIYFMRSVCDTNCTWEYQVEKRTEKTLTLIDHHGNKKNCRVKVWNDVETVMPLGSYSMAPMLSADKPLRD